MEQNMKRLKREIYGDEQIISSGCCASFARSSSQTAIYHTDSSQKSLRSSRERGIKLTKKLKFHGKSISQTKITLQRPTQPLQFNRSISKRSSQSSHPSADHLIPNQGAKKFIFVQKCLEYKNKRIRQHEDEVIISNPLTCQASSKEQVCSTMRNTQRTFTSCQGFLLVQKPIMYSNSASLQVPFLKRYKQQRSNIYSERTLLINKKAASKTLQRIFQETQGKKLVTLESHILSEDYSNENSIAESYQFPQIRI